MAKMFYSLEEAAQKLGKTPAEVRDLATSGQLQEFRDRDKLMFKREQVDLLSGDEGGESGSHIPLADSKGGSDIAISLEDSGPGGSAAVLGAGSKGGSGSGTIELDEGPKEKSGISIFDTESLEEGDPSAVTRVTETAGAEPLSLESVGSGSGLLDLTREADDTSLGADLLEDVYKPEGEDGAAGGSETQGASGLFETTAAASDVSAAAAPAIGMVAAEPYDGAGSGWAGGLALGMALIIGVALFVVLTGISEALENPVVTLVASNFWMYIGIFAGVLAVFAVVGLLLGKRT